MEKVIFAIKYEVIQEKTDEFLDVVREFKNIIKAEGLENYSVFAVKGKKNIYQEILTFENKEAFDNYDDTADERAVILTNKLNNLVKPSSTEYLTLTEI